MSTACTLIAAWDRTRALPNFRLKLLSCNNPYQHQRHKHCQPLNPYQHQCRKHCQLFNPRRPRPTNYNKPNLEFCRLCRSLAPNEKMGDKLANGKLSPLLWKLPSENQVLFLVLILATNGYHSRRITRDEQTSDKARHVTDEFRIGHHFLSTRLQSFRSRL